MKLFLQVTILATFVASMVLADHSVVKVTRNRQLGNKKSKSFSLDDVGINPAHAEGEIGCRKECSDKRFTMVCEWEADKKKKKYYKSRRLGEQGGEAALDFEDEHEDNEEERELTYVSAPDGRRLGIELDHVECILGVGKKDSDDSSEDYEEYKERLKFPDDKWTIRIWDADAKVDFFRPDLARNGKSFRDSYKFTRKVEFEDIEDPNNSGDEITITGTLEIELFLIDSTDITPEFIVYDDSDLKFSC